MIQLKLSNSVVKLASLEWCSFGGFVHVLTESAKILLLTVSTDLLDETNVECHKAQRKSLYMVNLKKIVKNRFQFRLMGWFWWVDIEKLWNQEKFISQFGRLSKFFSPLVTSTEARYDISGSYCLSYTLYHTFDRLKRGITMIIHGGRSDTINLHNEIPQFHQNN